MIDTSVILGIADALQNSVIAKTELDSIKLALTKLIELKEQEIVKINAETLEQSYHLVFSCFTSYRLDQVTNHLVSLRIKNQENDTAITVIDDKINSLTIKLHLYLHANFKND